MARYLVTGATGFVGGEIARQLIGRGHQVSALVRAPERATLLGRLGVSLYAGDIRDASSLRAPMTGVDGVFHVAAWYKVGVREPQAERINVDGTRHVLETARELGVPKVVYTSTVAVLGDTHGRLVDETYVPPPGGVFLTEYERTKWKAHYEVALPMAAAGLPLVIVMPGLVYGPGDSSGVRDALVQAIRGRLPMAPTVTAYSWGYIEDIARGHLQAMESGRPGESYLLTGPAHTFEEAMSLAARLAGKRPPLLRPGPRVMGALAALTGWLERAGLRGPYDAETLRLLAGVTWVGSSDKASRELGFTTRSLDEGLRHTVEHELRQLNRP